MGHRVLGRHPDRRPVRFHHRSRHRVPGREDCVLRVLGPIRALPSDRLPPTENTHLTPRQVGQYRPRGRRDRIMFTKAWHLLRQTSSEFWSDNAMRLGAALAFYTALSLSPL